MIKAYLLLALFFCELICEAEPWRGAMFPQHPINGKLASIWISPLGKADEVRMAVLFKMLELSNKDEKVPLIKVADVEVTAETADGHKLRVIVETPDSTNLTPNSTDFGWGGNLWQQNQYRLFISKGEKMSQVKIKWGGETTVFKMSEALGGMSIDWMFRKE